MQRYSRQLILQNFGDEAQQKLLQAKVLVVGAGGLGCPVLQYLSAAGVGQIGIADGDKIALSNLHRQVLYDESVIGQLKVDVAIKKLKKLNSSVQYQGFTHYINQTNVFDIVEKYDIIVECTDNFAIRYLLNDVCALVKKPLVFASIFQYEAQLSVFHYGEKSFNLRDIFAEIPLKNTIPNCAEAGVLGALTGIIGSFQANEVIKIVTGIGNVCSGKLLLHDSLNNNFTSIALAKKDNIFIPKNSAEVLQHDYHFSTPKFTAIYTCNALKLVLDYENAKLIDVREIGEQPRITKWQMLPIPLSRLEENYTQLESSQHLIFVCKTGMRSKKAIDWLLTKFPDKSFYNIHNGTEMLK